LTGKPMAHAPLSLKPLSEQADKNALLDRLVEQARAMFPTLRERALGAIKARRLPRETIEEFVAAGFFKAFQPLRFGGYELDYGYPQLRLCGEVGRACGSSAWVLSVMNVHACQVGMFPLQAQEDVWGNSPDALICSAFVPDRSDFTPAPGGYRLAGRWKFSSGVDYAQWVMVGAPLASASSAPTTLWCLVPRHDFRIIDTWHSIGLRATGSNDIEIREAFIPAHRTVPLAALMAGEGPGAAFHRSHIYRIPAFSNSTLISAATGVARGALEEFVERLRNRPAVAGRAPAESETLDLEIARAGALIDSATAMLNADAQEYNAVVASGQKLNEEQCARFLRNPAFVGQALMEATDRLQNLSGAHGLDESSAIARAFVDIRAMMSHVGLRWHLAGRPWGQVALGISARNPHA
jgi:alkylation response protein AidB-like acyl-CoA dehydrogenase